MPAADGDVKARRCPVECDQVARVQDVDDTCRGPTDGMLMSHPLFIGDHFHSGFFIFIRHPHGYSDADILARFHLVAYRRSLHVARLDRYAAVSDDGEWTMLADDLYYTLWHMSTTQSAIEDIAKYHDVFVCLEGDCDRSFHYTYFRNGQPARRYEVSSPRYSDRIVVHSTGPLLPGESTLLENDGDYIGLALAETLGIKAHLTIADLRIYSPAP